MRLTAGQLRPFVDVNGVTWHHPSIHALMSLAKAGESPEVVIRRLCRELVAEAKGANWDGPPFDPEVLASFKDIAVEMAKDIQSDARIFPALDGRLLIQYNPTSCPERRRFSIAHEIVHTRFPDCFEEVRHRSVSPSTDRVHAELENLCNIGAAEILMPEDDVVPLLTDRPLTMKLVGELRSTFHVSREAMLRRICSLTDETCALVVMSLRLKPTELRSQAVTLPGFPRPQPKFRVDYASPSRSFRHHVPRHKSAPADSVVYQTTTHEFPAATENWDIRDLGDIRVQAAGLPGSTSDTVQRVAALISVC